MTKPIKCDRPRSLHIFLLDGNSEGVRIAQIAMSTIQAIAFHRGELKRVKAEFAEIARPGVYLLLGSDLDDPDKRIAYIGESEDVAQRLMQHGGAASKDFWTDTIVLISKDENLTKSHARFAEARLIKAGKLNTRWTLKNGNETGEEGKLPLTERAVMEEFIEQAQTLVGVLGCDLFKPLSGKLAASASPTASLAAAKEPATFFFKGEGFDARAETSSTGGLIVLAGSIARAAETPTIPKGAKKLREQMLVDGVLKQDATGLVFTVDRQFDSPSMAAGVVRGASVNGREDAWRLANGMTYGAWDLGDNTQQVAADEAPEQLKLLGSPADAPAP